MKALTAAVTAGSEAPPTIKTHPPESQEHIVSHLYDLLEAPPSPTADCPSMLCSFRGGAG